MRQYWLLQELLHGMFMLWVYLFANTALAVGENSRLCPLLLFVQLQSGEQCPLHFLSVFGEVRGKPFVSQSLTWLIAHFVVLFTALLQLFV